MFSKEEQRRRFDAAAAIMRREGLSAILLIGNGASAIRAYGCYRYFVDNRIYYHMQAAVLFPDSGVAVAAASPTHLLPLRTRGIDDVHVCGEDIISGVISILKERGITSGRIGVSLEMIPYGYYTRLREAFPDLVPVDVTEDIFAVRATRSPEETALYSVCAEVAYIGFKAVCDALHPGMAEHELSAELDYAMKRNGAEETFTLMSSGRFSFENNALPMLHYSAAPSRRIRQGDSVALEITPRCSGYWAQLVRTVSLGEPSDGLREMHSVVTGAIEDAVPLLRPGTRMADIVTHVSDYVTSRGYISALPLGHICAVDLNEERVDQKSPLVLSKGMAVILHPTVMAKGLSNGIFWGETYLVTEDGGLCLADCGKELPVIRREA